MKTFTSKMFRVGVLASAVATLFALSAPASAATATGNLPVSATVVAVCSVSTTPVAFGAYNTIGAATVNAIGSLAITCTKSTAVTNVTLDGGLNGTTGTYARTLLSGVDKIGYDLYVPSSTAAGAACAYTTKWTTAAAIFVPTAAPSNAARSYSVCGQTVEGQNVATIGTYNDTVGVTVSY